MYPKKKDPDMGGGLTIIQLYNSSLTQIIIPKPCNSSDYTVQFIELGQEMDREEGCLGEDREEVSPDMG